MELRVRVSDIGEVRFAPMLRQGAVTRDGDREAVTGMVMMLMGGNSRQVVEDVKQKIEAIQKTLPEGVYIDTFYDRTELVEKTIRTIAENISIGIVLVIIMLFLLLGDVLRRTNRSCSDSALGHVRADCYESGGRFRKPDESRCD